MALTGHWNKRRLCLAVMALWAVLSLVNLTRLVATPAPAVGHDSLPFITWARSVLPPDARYLYLQTGEFGTDTGLQPRLRYELYPRNYDDVRPHVSEAEVRAIVAREHRPYLLVPHAAALPADHWARQPSTWFHRLALNSDAYILVVNSGA